MPTKTLIELAQELHMRCERLQSLLKDMGLEVEDFSTPISPEWQNSIRSVVQDIRKKSKRFPKADKLNFDEDIEEPSGLFGKIKEKIGELISKLPHLSGISKTIDDLKNGNIASEHDEPVMEASVEELKKEDYDISGIEETREVQKEDKVRDYSESVESVEKDSGEDDISQLMNQLDKEPEEKKTDSVPDMSELDQLLRDEDEKSHKEEEKPEPEEIPDQVSQPDDIEEPVEEPEPVKTKESIAEESLVEDLGEADEVILEEKKQTEEAHLEEKEETEESLPEEIEESETQEEVVEDSNEKDEPVELTDEELEEALNEQITESESVEEAKTEQPVVEDSNEKDVPIELTDEELEEALNEQITEPESVEKAKTEQPASDDDGISNLMKQLEETESSTEENLDEQKEEVVSLKDETDQVKPPPTPGTGNGEEGEITSLMKQLLGEVSDIDDVGDEEEDEDEFDYDLESQVDKKVSTGEKPVKKAKKKKQKSKASLNFIKSIPMSAILAISAGVLVIALVITLLMVKKAKDHSPQRLHDFVVKADSYFSHGQYELAARYYRKILKTFPNTDESELAIFKYARCNYNLENWRTALDAYTLGLEYMDKRLEARPDGEIAYPNVALRRNAEKYAALCWWKLDESAIAREKLLEVQEKYPGPDWEKDILENLGIIYLDWAKKEPVGSRYKEVIEVYEKLLDMDPNSPRAKEYYIYIGDAYRSWSGVDDEDPEKKDKYLTEAELAYDHALAIAESEEDTPDVLFSISHRLGSTLYEKKNYEKALDVYRHLSNLDLEHEEKFRVSSEIMSIEHKLGNHEEVEKIAEELLNDKPEDDADILYTLGDSQYELGKYDSMVETYQEAIKKYPFHGKFGEDSQLAHMRLTNYYFFRQKKYEKAIENYETILQRYPLSPYAYRAKYLLGESYLALGEFDKAARQFDMVKEDFQASKYIDPEYYEAAHFKDGDAYYEAGYYEYAIPSYIEALQRFPLNPHSYEARLNLADAYYKEGDLNNALQVYSYYLINFPEKDEDGFVLSKMAELYRERMDYDLARKTWRTFQKKFPHKSQMIDKNIFISYSDESYVETDPKEAESLKRRAISEGEKYLTKYPGDRDVWRKLVRLYTDLGEHRLAVSALEEVIASYSDVESVPNEEMEELGDLSFNLGKYAETIGILSQLKWDVLEYDNAARFKYILAESYNKLGELDRAVPYYEELRGSYPESVYSGWAEKKLKDIELLKIHDKFFPNR